MKKLGSEKTVKRLGRILTMIPYIRQHPNITVPELAKAVGSKPSELLEDLNRRVLLCGVPPYLPNDYIDVHIQGNRVSVRFAEHFKRPVRFTAQEALALRAVLMSLAGPQISKRLLEKLDRVLSPETQRKVERARGRIGFLDHPLRMLQKVEEALRAGKEIEIEYYTASRDAMTKRTVRPYGTISYQGHWYVVAYCCLRGKELPFRVDRIKSIRDLETSYRIPKHFDLSRYEREDMYVPAQSGQEVMIRFDEDIARWIKEGIPRGKISECDDGGIILRLSTVHFEWLVRWVLPFGKHAEILSPPSLRKRMLQVSKEILGSYNVS